MRGRWSWADVRAGWIDYSRDRRHTGRPWAPCGAADYRAGWVAAWILKGIGRI